MAAAAAPTQMQSASLIKQVLVKQATRHRPSGAAAPTLFSARLGLATAAAITSATCQRDTWPPNSLSRGARRTLCVSL